LEKFEVLIGWDMAADRPVLSLKWLFFGFKGRIARKSFALAVLFQLTMLTLLIYQAVMAGEDEDRLAWVGLALIAFGFSLLWSILALTIKRLHDINLPSYFAGLIFIPFANWLVFFYLMFTPSHPEANEHGAPPFKQEIDPNRMTNLQHHNKEAS
jgi:uncharacterized membrane protein YhaH (DUF805 family)